jgi:cell division septation protein DedD
MTSDKGQISLASSIFRAFKEYKIDMEHGGETIPVASTRHDDKLLASKDSAGTGTNPVTVTDKKDILTEKNVIDPLKPPKENTQISQPPVKKDSAQPPEISNKPDTLKPVAVYTPPARKNTEPEKESVELFYTVQLGAVRNPGENEKSMFSKIDDVKAMVAEDGYTRFVSGRFNDSAEAVKHQAVIRSKGFADAFVTAYYRNKRITLKEAAAMRQKKIN